MTGDDLRLLMEALNIYESFVAKHDRGGAGPDLGRILRIIETRNMFQGILLQLEQVPVMHMEIKRDESVKTLS